MLITVVDIYSYSNVHKEKKEKKAKQGAIEAHHLDCSYSCRFSLLTQACMMFCLISTPYGVFWSKESQIEEL